MAKRIEYENLDLGIKFSGDTGGALNVAFLTRGRLRVWTSAGETVVLPESEVLELLRELIKRHPLDALGAIE